MSRPRDFTDLIDGMAAVERGTGVRLVDRALGESFFTYPELHDRTLETARRFNAQGVRQGHRVLIALATDVDSIAGFLALVYLGAIPYSVASPLVSQDRAAHRRHLVHLATLHRIHHVLATRDLAGIAEETDAHLLRWEPAQTGGLAAAAADTPTRARVEPDDVAFLQFSSGSTSQPKGVPITHRNLLRNLRLIVDNDRRTPESVMVAWLPLYHDMGLVGCLLSNLVHGNGTVLMDPLCFLMRPINWLAAISKHRGTLTAIPNFALDLCTDRITDEQLERHAIDLTGFGYIYNGAEPVRMESIRRFEERFAPYGLAPGTVRPVYGMSEATLIITAPRHDERPVLRRIDGVDVVSVGRPLGDFEVDARAEDGTALGPDRIGELWIRGESVTPGYLDSGGRSQDGWLPTGDLGLVDAEGRVYITGRKKDLIIYQGRNFYGHDIAARLGDLPQVRKGKVLVFGVDIDGQERVVVMTAAPRKGTAAAEHLDEYRLSIQRFVLREFGLPVHDVHVVGQFPKTTSGKTAHGRGVRIYLRHRETAAGLPGRG